MTGWTVAFILYLLPVIRSCFYGDFANAARELEQDLPALKRSVFIAALVAGILFWPLLIILLVFRHAYSMVR